MKPIKKDARPSGRLTPIRTARARIAALAAREQQAAVDLRTAYAARSRLVATGGSPPQIAKADARIASLRAKRDAVSAQKAAASADVLRRREDLLTGKTPDDLVATLAGSHPIALLPVRLETRFFNQGQELRVRIFPDQIHLDQHDPALTADEAAAAAWYWSRRAAAGGAATAATQEWGELVRRFGGWRAAWIVTAGRPGAPPPSARPARWSRGSVARALPDRWLVVGSSGGKEQFRKWGRPVPDHVAVSLTPDPAADPSAPPGPEPADLALPPELKWISDYAAAESIGMAVTITEADVAPGAPPLSSGVGRLVVVGADWTVNPAQGAAALSELLEGHLYSDGLSVIRQGTPTNNTTAMPAAVPAAMPDPIQLEAADAAPTAASRALGLTLGLADTAALRRVPGGGTTEVETAQHLLGALWSSTLGYYLATMLAPLIDGATQAAVREHAIGYVRPGGLAPVLLVGKQPYGILPVLPGARKSANAAWGYEPAASFEGDLFDTLVKMRQPWSLVTNWVPRIVDGAQPDRAASLEARMKSVLEQSPVAVALRYRRVLSVSTVANAGLPPEVKDVQERLIELLAAHFGWNRLPYLAGLKLEPDHYALPIPFVQAAAPGPAPLSPNYLAEIGLLLGQPRGRDELVTRLEALERGGTLLAALMAMSAIQAIDAATLRVIAAHAEFDPSVKAAVEHGYFPIGETINVLPRAVAPDGSVAIASPGDVARVILPAVDEKRPVAELVTAAAISSPLARKLPAGAVDQLRAFVADVAFLKDRNADEIDWTFRGVLDCLSYRLDAWITSLANRRLADTRARQASATGTHVGGYGWVEDLKPEPAAENHGYVFAPSVPHAATAAILRSGFISHSGDAQASLAVDLTSERVARALHVLDGVSRGQPLAALIGYRLERSLRTRSPLLARFILPLRSVAPLRPARAGTTPPAGPSESLSARDVCDGVALVDRLRSDRAALLADIQKAATSSPAAAAEVAASMPQVAAELAAIAELMDAVADVLTAETVHQTVLGNPERAGAALAVLDRQIRPIDAEVVETPRSGHRYTQRVAVVTNETLTADTDVADAVLAEWEPLCGDARAAAEPRVNAWVARMLGAPSRYRFGGALIASPDTEDEVRTPLEAIGLDDLGLSPLTLLAAAKTGSQGQPSELHQRIVQTLIVGNGNPLPEDTVVELDTVAPAGAANALGLGALDSMLGILADLLGSARSLDGRDLALAADTPAAAPHVEDLRTRADALVSRLRALAPPLHAARSQTPTDSHAIRAALLALSDAGVAGAFPGVPAGALTGEQTRRLSDQARDVDAAVAGALTRVDALDAAWTARPAKPASAEVEHHVARMRELLGKDFLVVTPFDVGRAADLATSLADQPSLTGGDALAPAGWLSRLRLVRPPLDRFAAAVTAADLLDNLPGDAGLRLTQLPHAPGARWLALPQQGARPSAELAFVFQSFTPFDFDGQPLAGFFCDEWSEAIPAASETVAATFHYNAPASRPPQAIVVAAPASMSQAAWSTDAVLSAVNEALELAKLRMIGPAQLDFHGLLLPTTYLPDGFTVDVPGIGFSKLKDVAGRGAAASVTGKSGIWKSS